MKTLLLTVVLGMAASLRAEQTNITSLSTNRPDPLKELFRRRVEQCEAKLTDTNLTPKTRGTYEELLVASKKRLAEYEANPLRRPPSPQIQTNGTMQCLPSKINRGLLRPESLSITNSPAVIIPKPVKATRTPMTNEPAQAVKH